MEICVLASGSAGNAIYVRSGDTAMLVDSGLTLRRLESRLYDSGLEPGSLSAVLLTHEHADHCLGVVPLVRRYDLPVYANQGTSAGLGLGEALLEFSTGVQFSIGCLEVLPFPVPHDSAEPVGLAITDGCSKAGIATDLGSSTLEVMDGLRACDLLVLESNHDEEMLARGPYPPFIKNRVAGPLGHLSNVDAASVARSVSHPGLSHIVFAHLSRTNNTPSLPLAALRGALGDECDRLGIHVGAQDRAGTVIAF